MASVDRRGKSAHQKTPCDQEPMTAITRGLVRCALVVLLWAPMSASGQAISEPEGGLNRSTQHSILKGKDGVFGNASRLFSRLYGIGENRALGSLAAGGVAESDWTSVW